MIASIWLWNFFNDFWPKQRNYLMFVKKCQILTFKVNFLWRPGIALGVYLSLSRDILNHGLPSLSPVSIQ